MIDQQRFVLEVRGDWACFTRPEMKVERVSYDVITPSAARAVFESIFYKPVIRWQVRRIEVLAPVRWANLRRNEVKSVILMGKVKRAMRGTLGDLALYVEEDRQQRAGLLLRDVAYRLHADLIVKPDRSRPDSPVKFYSMFRRRARNGQCVNQPYLGCREFAARWSLVDGDETPPINETRDLGWMLHDLDFSNPADAQPRFFRANMINGAIDVPSFDAQGVAQ